MLIRHDLEHKEYKITLSPIKTEGPQACLLPQESGVGAQFRTENLEGTCFPQHRTVNWDNADLALLRTLGAGSFSFLTIK